MATISKRKSFSAPVSADYTIVEGDKAKPQTVGRLRIKPNAILWKPKGTRGGFYKVSIEKFNSWVSDPATRAERVNQ